MRVLVVGAHGQIGRLVVQQLQSEPQIQVVAGLRQPAQIAAYQAQGVTTQLIDLASELNQLVQATQNVDAVVFAAGSGGKTGADQTMMIDLDGAVKMIQAAQLAQAKRFVMVSALQADNRGLWSYQRQELATGNYYYAAKYYADQWLMHSGLDYTIIRPAVLTNAAGQGRIQLAPRLSLQTDTGLRSIARADVAATIVACLKNHLTIHQAFDLSSGEQPIEQAIASF